MATTILDVTAEFGLPGLVFAFAVTEPDEASVGGSGAHGITPEPTVRPQACWVSVHPDGDAPSYQLSQWVVSCTLTDLVLLKTNDVGSGDAAAQAIVYLVPQWSRILRSRLRDALVAAATVQAARG